MANRQLYPKVLFFISSTAPTQEQLDAANEYGPGVVFRNASMITDDGPIEDADAVAGEVPARYKDALPGVDDREAIDARMKARDPNNATMFQADRFVRPYSELTDEQRDVKNVNDVSRGAKPAPVNERNSEPRQVEHRLSQAGTPRVEQPLPDTGWGTGTEGETDTPRPYAPMASNTDPITGRPTGPAGGPSGNVNPGQPSNTKPAGNPLPSDAGSGIDKTLTAQEAQAQADAEISRKAKAAAKS